MSIARHPARAWAAVVLGVALVAGCAGTTPLGSPTGSTSSGASAAPSETVSGSITVYSGRAESLVKPVIEQFEGATGVDVQVRYGDTAELAATILEEAGGSPADVYFGQDAGALGALAAEGRLAALPGSILDRVESRFRSPDGVWVGVSGRARVAAYHTGRLAATDLPASILGFADAKWKGRIGWVPTNGSFQAFVTALRVVEGEGQARSWLEGMQANQPKVYERNPQALEAAAAGEVDVALINHYYLYQAIRQQGRSYPVANHVFSGGDPGALVNVAGAGVLVTSRNAPAARALVAYLLGDEAQRYFATETFEYPLVAGVPPDPRLTPLSQITSPDLDLSDLSDLRGTLELLRDLGIL
jgi:iron(III) transport system substrate-binding protein